MTYRPMTSADVPAVFEITVSGREKSFSREALAAVGITEETTVAKMDEKQSHSGWICEVDGREVGFVMADKTTGEVWVLVVRDEYERRGIGTHLHELALQWLVLQGWKEAWLGLLKDIQVSGYTFFLKRGYVAYDMNGPFTLMKRAIG